MCRAARGSLVGHAWKLASVKDNNGRLWEPSHIEFVVENGRSLVRCNGGAAHGSWSELGDTLTLTYHYMSVDSKAKTSKFQRIAGACAYLKTTGDLEWRSVLVPFGSLVGHAWKLASVKDNNGRLWEPSHIEFVVENGRSLVRCNGGAAHGSWSELGDTLTLTYHYMSVDSKAKTSKFQRIAGACAYLKTTGDLEWRSVLVPFG